PGEQRRQSIRLCGQEADQGHLFKLHHDLDRNSHRSLRCFSHPPLHCPDNSGCCPGCRCSRPLRRLYHGRVGIQERWHCLCVCRGNVCPVLPSFARYTELFPDNVLEH